MKNVRNSSRGRSQGVPKFFSALMYRAHCAVIFAIAQLSCDTIPECDGHTDRQTDGRTSLLSQYQCLHTNAPVKLTGLIAKRPAERKAARVPLVVCLEDNQEGGTGRCEH